MSLAFVGRVYSSLKGFYNEINSATLTGAIDVVIVKQEDGSYLSSPFHVRMGKMGVLRSKEKLVDIEINGEPVDLRMKLGEAGEAFFVQGITEEEREAMGYSVDLVTSPIESSDELMCEGLALLKEASRQQDLHHTLQHLDPLGPEEDDAPSDLLHRQAKMGEEEKASLAINLSSLAAKAGKSDSSWEEDHRRLQGKKPQRRKVFKKKKQKHGPARSSPRSQSMPEGLGLVEQDHIFDMEVSESTSDDEEAAAAAAASAAAAVATGYGGMVGSRSASLDLRKGEEMTSLPRWEDEGGTVVGVVSEDLALRERRVNSFEAFLTPFSEPELSPPQSPLPTRPPSPKSDTEVDRQHTEEVQAHLMQDTSATWEWGEFPKQNTMGSALVGQPSKEHIDMMLERQDSEKVVSGGLLSLWMKQKKTGGGGSPAAAAAAAAKAAAAAAAAAANSKKGEEAKGMYLDDLASLEDPEIAKLYLGSPRFQSIREREREDDSESGRGASLPQSPHSVDGAVGGPVSFLQSEVRHLGPVSLSLCGGLSDSEPLTLDKFMQKVITFDDLAEHTALLHDPNLVVKIRDGYFNWTTAAPMVLCEMAFNKQLPEGAVTTLVKKNMPKKALSKKKSWWSWRSSTNHNAETGGEGGGEEGGGPPAVSTHSSSHLGTAIVTSDNEPMSSKVSESSLSPLVSPATSPSNSVHSTPRKVKADRPRDMEHASTETDTDNSEKETLPASPLQFSPPLSPPPIYSSSSLPSSSPLPTSSPLVVPSSSPLAAPSTSPMDIPSTSPVDVSFSSSVNVPSTSSVDVPSTTSSSAVPSTSPVEVLSTSTVEVTIASTVDGPSVSLVDGPSTFPPADVPSASAEAVSSTSSPVDVPSSSSPVDDPSTTSPRSSSSSYPLAVPSTTPRQTAPLAVSEDLDLSMSPTPTPISASIPITIPVSEPLSSPPLSPPLPPSYSASVDVDVDEASPEKYIKSLRLTTEQVEKLKLRPGRNEISYSVTTQYQGTSRCTSHIYLWNYDDKIVISDIDGTITKSDVMGQILPLLGRDWSQSGVAQLFTRLSSNGYKLLYLSARAIGQSRITKDLLKSIRQGDRVLPDGPLMLNPTSLISAFHREVIEKNPEEFKISCLRDIAALFPASPFYAGFGNKINDVIAYRALNIPRPRIFTINPQGHLRHDMSYTFLSSYSKMSDIADHFFPPITASSQCTSNEFSSVLYWRTPPPQIDTSDIAQFSSAKTPTPKTTPPKPTTTTTTPTPIPIVVATTTTSTTPPPSAITVEIVTEEATPPPEETTTAITTATITISSSPSSSSSDPAASSAAEAEESQS